MRENIEEERRSTRLDEGYVPGLVLASHLCQLFGRMPLWLMRIMWEMVVQVYRLEVVGRRWEMRKEDWNILEAHGLIVIGGWASRERVCSCRTSSHM